MHCGAHRSLGSPIPTQRPLLASSRWQILSHLGAVALGPLPDESNFFQLALPAARCAEKTFFSRFIVLIDCTAYLVQQLTYCPQVGHNGLVGWPSTTDWPGGTSARPIVPAHSELHPSHFADCPLAVPQLNTCTMVVE